MKLIRLFGVFREDFYRFGHAMKEMIVPHGIGETETVESLLGARRFEPGDRESDVQLFAVFDEFQNDLRRREIDFDNAAGFHDDKFWLGVLEDAPGLILKFIGVEKSQGCLESDDQNTFEPFAFEITARRPPNRGSWNPFEYNETGARHRPYSMQQRQHDASRDARSHWEHDDRHQGREDQQELTESLPENRDDFSRADDPHRDEKQNSGKRRLRHMREKPGAEPGDTKDQHHCCQPGAFAASA